MDEAASSKLRLGLQRTRTSELGLLDTSNARDDMKVQGKKAEKLY